MIGIHTLPTPCAIWLWTLHTPRCVINGCVNLPTNLPLLIQMVVLLDADFVIAPQRFGMLLHDAADRAVYLALRKLLTERRRVLVIPAFNSSAELHDTSALHILNGMTTTTDKALQSPRPHCRRQTGACQSHRGRSRCPIPGCVSPRHQLHPVVRMCATQLCNVQSAVVCRWEAEQPYPIEFGAAGKVYKMPGEVRHLCFACASHID